MTKLFSLNLHPLKWKRNLQFNKKYVNTCGNEVVLSEASLRSLTLCHKDAKRCLENGNIGPTVIERMSVAS